MRRTAAGVLAGALALSGAVATALPANAAAGFELTRIAGEDRYQTSALTVAAFGSASGAIVAAGESGRTPDALAASFLAGVRNVPVALTTKNRVTDEVLAALNGLGGKNITVVGGTAAVSDSVVTQLRAAGFTVDRLAGDHRYETAREIVEAGESAAASNVGLVASGTSTIDALAGGPLAFAGKHPMFLVTRDGIPGATLQAIRASGVTSVFVLGGEAVVGPNVVAQLATAGVTVVDRLAGDDRSETSVEIANRLIADFNFSASTFNLASGLNEGIDALGGAALSGKERRVLLVTNNATSAAPVTGFATARAATLMTPGRIFGGTAVVAQTLETSVETAGGAAASNQSFTLTPADSATLSLVSDETNATATDAAADNRSYSVSTSAAGQTHQIVLVPAANVTVGANGSVSFTEDAATNLADFGTVAARISEVNGVQVATASQQARATAVPVAGTITFTIEGNAAESVVPVVFFDADNDTRLDLNADNTPTSAEMFGVGGATTFINPAATSQVLSSQPVQAVNKTANQFDAIDLTFTYDSNDTFSVADAGSPGTFIPATLDEFETRLSRGDTIAATYSATSGASSSFRLVDANPVAPSTVTAEAGTGSNSDDITVTVPVTASVDSVVIQRATVTGGGTDETATGTVGAYATIATISPTAAQRTAGSVTFVDNNVAEGVYRYRAAVTSDGQQSGFTADVNNEASTPPAADTTSPQATATTLMTDAGFAGLLDVNDVFTVRTDEALAAPAAGSTLRIQDADGTVVDLVCGTNATCSLNASAIADSPTGPNAGAAANTVLTVTVTAAPTVVTAGTTGLQYNNATITNTAGITDVAGNRFNVTVGDRVIDAATTTPTSPTSPTDTTPPAFVSAVATAGTLTMTVTYSEALNTGSVQAADYSLTLSGGAVVSPRGASASGNTVTLTFGGSNFTAGMTGTLNKVDGTDVLDVAGNDQADADSVGFTTVTA